MISVKLCGLSTESALRVAINLGTEYAGFVFYAPSPRNVTLAQAAKLAGVARERIKTVALIVDASDSAIAEILSAVSPDYFQLHGSETIGRVREIRRLTGTPVIKAIKVRTAQDIGAARGFEADAEMLLFDAHVEPTAGNLPGGNGVSFDWTWLRDAPLRQNFMLSGGLTPANVTHAIWQSGASAVDVSSGIETSPGVKDETLIASFVRNAKQSNTAHPTLPIVTK